MAWKVAIFGLFSVTGASFAVCADTKRAMEANIINVRSIILKMFSSEVRLKNWTVVTKAEAQLDAVEVVEEVRDQRWCGK